MRRTLRHSAPSPRPNRRVSPCASIIAAPGWGSMMFQIIWIVLMSGSRSQSSTASYSHPIAGPNAEAQIAGRGSGAARWSSDHYEQVTSIDIGGGTSNAAVFNMGQHLCSSAIAVGAGSEATIAALTGWLDRRASPAAWAARPAVTRRGRRPGVCVLRLPRRHDRKGPGWPRR